jgi:hypothetical protein
MEREFEQHSDSQLLAVIDAALDALTDDRLRLASDAEQLALLQAGVRIAARLQAWQQQAAAGIEQSQAAWNVHQTSTRTWLAESLNLTPREAARLIKAGQGQARFPVVGAAGLAGSVLPAQTEAITDVLTQLPDEFDADVVAEAQEVMVGFASSHNSRELRQLTTHLIEVLAPATADRLEAERLEAQERRAQTRRFLDFHPDGDGSVLLRGSLPIADAEPLIRIVDAYAAAEKRGIERLDPTCGYVPPATRRADALIAMAHAHTIQATTPRHGGDRPRIVLTLSYDKLAKHCTDANLGGHLVSTGDPLPASVARRLLCDADIVPMILGSASLPLDVGRTERLVTPAIRTALEIRDGGCVFPGCDKPPGECEAHHVIPWYRGGPTALPNLVSVCRHHHGILEPGRDPHADRWKLVFRDDGIPTVVPPRRVDPRQQPRVHARFTTRR